MKPCHRRYCTYPSGSRNSVYGNRSIVPDVVVIAKNHLPLDESGDRSSAGIEFAPPWVIEILSPAQSQTKVTGNMLHCLRHGSQLGWLLDPHERSILVYQPDRLPELLFGSDRLTALDGVTLSLAVETVYGWLQRN
jgi:Uma2 family endonuclease